MKNQVHDILKKRQGGFRIMNKTCVALGSILMILLLGLNGCVEEESQPVTHEDYDSFVGTWQLDDGFGSIIFHVNGTGKNGPWDMEWQIKEERLLMNTTFNETIAESIFEYRFYDETMVELIDTDSRQNLRYRRV